jgi:uncharacterized protein YndB with AHSA1/START domain
VAVDVQAEVEIARPRLEVATYAADPDNATEWYASIDRVEGKAKKKRLGVGSRFVFVGTVVGQRLSYTYTVTEFIPLERLVMQTDDGPFAVETTYTWEDAGDGATTMTLRSRGEPSGVRSRLAGPMMGAAMRRANRNDLARLKALLEGS